MKYAECNIRQKKAWKNVMHAASFNIFGLMNTCLDEDPDSQEYRSAMNTLRDLEGLKELVYSEAITSVYSEDGVEFGLAAEVTLRDIRFCGKDFIMKIVNHYCKKYQSEALAEIA